MYSIHTWGCFSNWSLDSQPTIRQSFSKEVLSDRCQVDVSENSGTPKSSTLIGFSIINHPSWGTPIFGNTQVFSGSNFNTTVEPFHGLLLHQCEPRIKKNSDTKNPWNPGCLIGILIMVYYKEGYFLGDFFVFFWDFFLFSWLVLAFGFWLLLAFGFWLLLAFGFWLFL